MRFIKTAFRLALAVGLAAVLLPTLAQAGEGSGTRKIGLSASLQGRQMDIMLPIWLNNDWVITPSIGGTHVSDAITDYGLGLAVRHNAREGEVIPYFGLRSVVLVYTRPGADDALTDYVLGVFFGGECFLQDNLSVGVEAQLNRATSDDRSQRFGNPGGWWLTSQARNLRGPQRGWTERNDRIAETSSSVTAFA